MSKKLPDELLKRIQAVTNKRARFVLDHIVKHGSISTEQLKKAGYDHPPRAARDVRELGIGLVTITAKSSTGRRIGAYVFSDDEVDEGKSGRRILPKREREELIEAANGRCQICSSTHNLQVDHRIPYEVAGESEAAGANPYQILCGSCNRTKSWTCEFCENRVRLRVVGNCRSCYWAEPSNYRHIAMQEQRRVEVVWAGEEVREFDRVQAEAAKEQRTVSDKIKDLVQRSV